MDNCLFDLGHGVKAKSPRKRIPSQIEDIINEAKVLAKKNYEELPKILAQYDTKVVAKYEKIEYNKSEGIAVVSSRYLNKNDQLYKNAAKIVPLEDFEDIVVHGDRHGLFLKILKIKK